MDNATRWVGIDLHRRRSHIAVIDEQGELKTSRRIVNDREAFLELLGDAAQTHVALEATYGWEWLAELLEEAGYDLHLAHPLRTRAIASARVKTDAIDAKTLAHLLRAGLLPEAYIAPRELRDLRELLRHRATLTSDAGVEGLQERVLPRAARLDEHAAGGAEATPVAQRVRRQLGPVSARARCPCARSAARVRAGPRARRGERRPRRRRSTGRRA